MDTSNNQPNGTKYHTATWLERLRYLTKLIRCIRIYLMRALAERIKALLLRVDRTRLAERRSGRTAIGKSSGVGNNRPSNSCRWWGHRANVFDANIRTGGVHCQGFGGKDPLCIQRTGSYRRLRTGMTNVHNKSSAHRYL